MPATTMRLRFIFPGTLACGLSLLGSSTAAHAQAIERLAIHADGGAAVFLGGDAARRFGAGGGGEAHLGVRVFGPLEVQAGLGTYDFGAPNGLPPGQLTVFGGGLRVNPRVGPRVVGGPVLEADANLAITGGLDRFAIDIGAGWEFALADWLGAGVLVRYVHVFDSGPQAEDAQFLQLGLGLTLRVPPHHEAAPQVVRDTDHDGVPDDRDRCPTEPEDHDNFQDDDGCPDPDNDGDGIPDAQDQCPNQPETRNGFQDEDGCADTPPPPPPPPASSAPPPPPPPPMLVPIGDPILFGYGSTHIRPEARRNIQAMCTLLQQHPEWHRVRLAGNADERGSAEGNMVLSSERASVVAAALIHCGVSTDRLESTSFGEGQPTCHDGTDACHSRNRRVDFFRVEQEGAGRAP